MQLEKFGILLCLSCGGVLNVPALKRFVDYASKMGYNCIELCLDDMIKIKEEPMYGFFGGGLSSEQLKEVDQYAFSKGIEIIPTIQTLAHLPRITSNPHFADIVDIGPVLLVGEPKTYEFIEKIFKTVSETFITNKLNIGFDEAFNVGLGNYLIRNGYRDKMDIMLEHLQKVKAIADKYNRELQMWHDMFFSGILPKYVTSAKNIHVPENVLNRIPAGIALNYWEYDSTDPELYDSMFNSCKEFKRDVWYTCAIHCANRFEPLLQYGINRAKVQVPALERNNMKNYIVALWGDDNNECSYFSAVPALFAVSEFVKGNFDEELIAKKFEELFGVSYHAFFTIEEMNRYCRTKNEIHCSMAKNLLYNDPFLGLRDYTLKEILPLNYENASKEINKYRGKMKEFNSIFEKYYALSRVMEIKHDLGLRTREAYSSHDKAKIQEVIKRYEELINRLDIFHDAFRSDWRVENNTFGWDVNEYRVSGLIGRIKDCKRTLEEYVNNEITQIDELEAELLSYAKADVTVCGYYGLASVRGV